MEGDEQNLREKARLLLQRERELFELRLKHDQLTVWLGIGHALPELFLNRGVAEGELWGRLRKMLVSKLGLQRVLVLEIHPQALRPKAPAGPERPVPAAVDELLSSQPSGWCNDPDAEPTPGVAALAEVLGLHRFMWSRIKLNDSAPILITAGFDRARAAFQSRLVHSDAAHFSNAAQHVEHLLGNEQLIAELEREKDQLRQANVTLEHRDRELQKATEQLRAANETLEQRVRERTQELAGKNRDLRLVLDNVDQALVTIDLEGHMAPERSSVVDRWFGPYAGRPLFVDHVAVDRGFAQTFRLGLDALREDLLPRELCLEQMPKRLVVGARQLECRYLSIDEAGELAGLLLVLDDVTEHLAQARKEAQQRELLAAFTALMRDRNGFLTFCDESERMFRELSRADIETAGRKRLLHTLKGNAAIFGLQLIVELSHRAETEVQENSSAVPETLELLRTQWAAIVSSLRAAVPAEQRRTIQVSEPDLAKLTEQAQRGAPASQIITELRRLGWEPVDRSLNRLAQHSQALASRLGKAPLHISVDNDEVMLDPERWAPLWSALTHVVRNAVDHGIEQPEQREDAGKPPGGRLRLSARRIQEGFRLEIADDGRGIDWDAVRSRCLEKGYPSATQTDLEAAIFAPDFSTRNDVTETSGRGVGLAVVASVVRDLSGTLALSGEPNGGTRWTLTFPTR